MTPDRPDPATILAAFVDDAGDATTCGDDCCAHAPRKEPAMPEHRETFKEYEARMAAAYEDVLTLGGKSPEEVRAIHRAAASRAPALTVTIRPVIDDTALTALTDRIEERVREAVNRGLRGDG